MFLELLKVAEKIGKRIAALKEAASKAGIPVIYVNDNFGKWKSDFHNVIEYVIKENKPGIYRACQNYRPPFVIVFFSMKKNSWIKCK